MSWLAKRKRIWTSQVDNCRRAMIWENWLVNVVVVVQSSSCVLTLCDPMDCSMPGLSVLHHLPEVSQVMSVISVIPSSHLILWHRLILLCSVFPSIGNFSNESPVRIRLPEYWSFSFSISLSSKYSGWFPLRLTGLISLLSK